MTDRADQTGADDIIESAYRITIDPDRMAVLLSMWDRHLGELVEGELDTDPEKVEDILAEKIKRHFDAAAEILEKTALKTGVDPLKKVVEDHDLACFTVSTGGVIASANGTAIEQFNVRPGSTLELDLFDGDSVSQVRNLLATLREPRTNQRHFAALAWPEPDEKPVPLEMFIIAPKNIATPVAVFRAIQPTLSEHAEQVLEEAFGLTPVEASLVRALLGGNTIQEFADARGTSVQTARVQLRSILRKTSSAGQVDLVRLAGGLSAARAPELEEDTTPSSDLGARWEGPLGEETELVLPDGRKLYYAHMGLTGGRPVLALHGSLIGYLWPPKLREEMREIGVDIIAPSRPGYGSSDRGASGIRCLESASHDMARLLDSLKIDRCPVFGHVLGSAFAQSFARHHPDRVSHVICVAGYYPMTDNLILNHMAPWQRSFLRTARYAPSLLRFMARAGRALMVKQGSETFGQGLFKTSPADLAVLRDADNAATFRASANLTISQGVDAFIDDSIVITSDWTQETPEQDVPMTLIHGTEDPCVPMEAVHRFARSKPNSRVVELPEAGQLALYAKPDAVREEILKAVGLHNTDGEA